MRLKTDEVPVRFLKDKEGRFSHHKRSGWLSPWKAGWINLRVMLVNGAEFFALRPGLLLFFLGLCLTLPLAFGPIRVGHLTFSIFWMLLGMSFTVVGLQSFYMGCIARVLHDYSNEAQRYWLGLFSYNRSLVVSGLLVVGGCLFLLPLCYTYWSLGLDLPIPIGSVHHMAITGLLGIILGFMNFVFTLVFHAVAATLRNEDPQSKEAS
jgi:hypothetical protein